MVFPFSSVFELFLRLFIMPCPVQNNPYNTEKEKFSPDCTNIFLKRDLFYYTVHVILHALHGSLCKVSTKLQEIISSEM